MTLSGVLTHMLVFSVVFFVILHLCVRYAGTGMANLSVDLRLKFSHFSREESNMIYWFLAAAVNLALCVIALIFICREERKMRIRPNQRIEQAFRLQREEFAHAQDVLRERDERGYTGAFGVFRNASKYLVVDHKGKLQITIVVLVCVGSFSAVMATDIFSCFQQHFSMSTEFLPRMKQEYFTNLSLLCFLTASVIAAVRVVYISSSEFENFTCQRENTFNAVSNALDVD